MVGSVHVDKGGLGLSCLFAAGVELWETGAGPVLGERLVGCNLDDILVLGDQPGQTAVEQLDLGDGFGGTQLGELGRRLHA
jgi:hypothetical protein